MVCLLIYVGLHLKGFDPKVDNYKEFKKILEEFKIQQYFSQNINEYELIEKQDTKEIKQIALGWIT